MKHAKTLALGALALALSATAAAEITFYGQEHFRGRAFTLESSAPNLLGTKLNDRASSLSVRSGTWQVCSEPYYRGDCVTLPPGDYRTLRAVGLDNRVSSAREVGWRGGGGGGPRERRGVVLYEGPSFAGRSVSVEGSAESLEGFNDRARSMIVYDGEWELCEHDRFRGDCVTFGPGRHPNLGRLAGDLSSLRMVAGAPGPGPDPDPGWGRGVRVVLYGQPNFGGRSMTVSDGLVPDLQGSGFDDRASSLRVERGYWVFCSEPNFHGECRTFGPGDYPTLPPELNNAISSGRRIHDRYPYDREPNWGR